jgi:hypothetical protein
LIKIDEIPPYTTTNNQRKNLFSVKDLKNNINKISSENILINEKVNNFELNTENKNSSQKNNF